MAKWLRSLSQFPVARMGIMKQFSFGRLPLMRLRHFIIRVRFFGAIFAGHYAVVKSKVSFRLMFDLKVANVA
jgi:hypothetical protein